MLIPNLISHRITLYVLVFTKKLCWLKYDKQFFQSLDGSAFLILILILCSTVSHLVQKILVNLSGNLLVLCFEPNWKIETYADLKNLWANYISVTYSLPYSWFSTFLVSTYMLYLWMSFLKTEILWFANK